MADATAYLHAETSPWPTKGATACSEVASQPTAGKLLGAKLSIPESPDQLRDPSSKGDRRSDASSNSGPQQLVTPVAFWNADLATPDAPPEGQLIRACYGRDELLTPSFPAASPPGVSPGGTPLPFGGGGFRSSVPHGGSSAVPAGAVPGLPAVDRSAAPAGAPQTGSRDGGASAAAQQQQQPGSGVTHGVVSHGSPAHQQHSPSPAAPPLTPWGNRSPLWEKAQQSLHQSQPQQLQYQQQPYQQQPQHQQQPHQRHSTATLSQCTTAEPLLKLPPLTKCGSLTGSLASSGSLLAPYSPAASGSNVGEEDLLSCRHDQSHHDGDSPHHLHVLFDV